MQNNENNIDGLFKDGLANFEVTPPPIVWDKIAESMGHKKRKVRALWFWTMSGAASLLIAFVAGWYLSNDISSNQDLLAEMQLLKQTQLKKIIIESPINNDLHIHFNKPQFQKLSLLASNTDLNSGSKVEILNSKQLTKSSADSANENNQLVLMHPLSFQLNQSTIFNCVLIKDKNKIDEFDRQIIEANLLAMNNESHTDSEKGKWFMGVQASPVYRFEQSGNSELVFNDGSENVKNTGSSNYKPNMAAGLSVSYEAGKKLAIISGVNYTEVSQNSSKIGVDYSGTNWFASKDYVDLEPVYDLAAESVESVSSNNVTVNTNVGSANVILPKGAEASTDSRFNNSFKEIVQTYDFEQAAGYVEVPLLLKYKLVDKRFGIHLLGGVNANVLVTNNVKLKNNGEVVASGNVDDLSPITYSSSMGMGMNYNISERFRINIDPMLKIQLNSLNTQTNFNARPYAFGVYSGITYQF